MQRRDDDKLLLTDGVSQNILSDRVTAFHFPFEPDGSSVTLLMQFDDMAENGKLTDRSGFKNHATAPTGVIPPSTVIGHNEGAFRFDGISNYLTIPDNISLQFRGLASFSISLWFNPSNIDFLGSGTSTPVARRLLSKTDDINNGWTLVVTPYKTLVFGIRSSTTSGQFRYVTSAPVVNVLNVWYHVVITWLNTAPEPSLVMYVNNVRYTNTTNPYTVQNNNDTISDFYIGDRDPHLPGGHAYFAGELDDLIFYRNRALTIAEVNNLYTNTRSITTGPVAIVGHFWITQAPGFSPVGYDSVGFDTGQPPP